MTQSYLKGRLPSELAFIIFRTKVRIALGLIDYGYPFARTRTRPVARSSVGRAVGRKNEATRDRPASLGSCAAPIRTTRAAALRYARRSSFVVCGLCA